MFFSSALRHLIDDADPVFVEQCLEHVHEGEEGRVHREFSIHHAVEPFMDVVRFVCCPIHRDVSWPLELHPIFDHIVVQSVELADDLGGAVNCCDGSNFLPDSFHLGFHILRAK